MDEQNKTNDALFQDAPYAKEITALYDAQKEAQLQQLKGAYDQSVQTLQQEQPKIAQAYATQTNDLAAQYERTRMNNNLQAANNGLNTGAGSQMALAQQGNYLSAYGGLKTQQAQAEQAIQDRLAEMEISYKNAVAQAIADNDYQRAAALFAEYKNAGMGGYGSGGYSGGGGGRSRGGGGSTTGAIEGAGSFNLGDGQTPTALSGSATAGSGYDFDQQRWKYMDRYGNEIDALANMSRDLERTARGQAEMEAIQRGLTPGGSGYNSFVSSKTQELLGSNVDYISARSAYNELAAQQKADRENEQNKADAIRQAREMDEFYRQAYGAPDDTSSSLRGVQQTVQQYADAVRATQARARQAAAKAQSAGVKRTMQTKAKQNKQAKTRGK